jgi:hypothetical protein
MNGTRRPAILRAGMHLVRRRASLISAALPPVRPPSSPRHLVAHLRHARDRIYSDFGLRVS